MITAPLRLSLIVVGIAIALPGTTARAQQVGDSMETITRTLGQPTIAMNRGGNVVWSYADGRKVTFRNGVAIAVTAPLPAEKMGDSVGEADEVDEPAPARSRASMPAQQPADAALLRRRAADLAPHRVGVIEWTLRVLAIGVGVATWTLRRPFRAVVA